MLVARKEVYYWMEEIFGLWTCAGFADNWVLYLKSLYCLPLGHLNWYTRYAASVILNKNQIQKLIAVNSYVFIAESALQELVWTIYFALWWTLISS